VSVCRQHEKGTSRSRPQSPQRNRANPPASQPHCRKFRNSCSTNRGRPSPSRKHADLHAEGLEVIVHDLVERTLRGTPRFVARRGRGHSTQEGRRRASEEPDEMGLNPKIACVLVAVSARRVVRTGVVAARRAPRARGPLPPSPRRRPHTTFDPMRQRVLALTKKRGNLDCG